MGSGMKTKKWGIWVDGAGVGWMIDGYNKRTNDSADWVEIHTKFNKRREAQKLVDELNNTWRKRKKIYSVKEYK